MADQRRLVRGNKLVKVDYQDEKTIAADDTTPDVSVGDVFVTTANTGATAISALDNPRIGSRILLIGGSSTNASTLADSGNFKIDGALTLNEFTCIELYIKSATEFIQVNRSVN